MSLRVVVDVVGPDGKRVCQFEQEPSEFKLDVGDILLVPQVGDPEMMGCPRYIVEGPMFKIVSRLQQFALVNERGTSERQHGYATVIELRVVPVEAKQTAHAGYWSPDRDELLSKLEAMVADYNGEAKKGREFLVAMVSAEAALAGTALESMVAGIRRKMYERMVEIGKVERGG